MVDAWRRAEREQLIADSDRSAVVARRSVLFTVQLTIACSLYAAGPLLPRAEHIFGELSVAQGFAFMAPGVLMAYVNVVIFRLRGPDSKLYVAAETLESFLLYAANLAFIYAGGIHKTVLWLPPVFAAAFWATTKPFSLRLYGPTIVVAHSVLVGAFVLRGNLDSAVIAVAAGAASFVTYVGISTTRQRRVFLQVERNHALRQLNASRLDQERDRIAQDIWVSVGNDIADVATQLEQQAGAGDEATHAAIRQARAALAELSPNAWAPMRSNTGRTVFEVAGILREKCLALCPHATFTTPPAEQPGSQSLSAEQARVVLRVTQELVRNAVTHGAGNRVHVELRTEGGVSLRVSNDGPAPDAAHIESATGGIYNARAWLTECGGSLSFSPTFGGEPGATFEVTIPLDAVSGEVA